MRGSSLACAACWGSRRGRPRQWRGPPGPRSQLLARPPRSPLLLWRPPARRPWPVQGPVPRVGGVLGVAAWSAEAVARPAGAAVATPRAPSSLSSAAVAAAGQAPVAREGSVPRVRGVLGVAAWLAEVVARPAGAAVATPGAPLSLSSAAAAALRDTRGSCAGATPRVGGVPGTAVGAWAWLTGAAVSASCASGAPSRGGTAGLAAWAAGAVISAGSGSRAGGGGRTSTAASASLRFSRS